MRHLRFTRPWEGVCFSADPTGPGVTPPPATPPAPAAPPRAPSGDDPAARIAQLTDELRSTRVEAAENRISARDARDKITRLEADLAAARTDAERQITETRTTMTTQLQTERAARIDAEVRAAALAAGLKDADLVALVNRQGITVNEAGQIVGVTEAITALRERKPEYFRTSEEPPPPPARSTGSPVPPPRPSPGGPAPTTVNAIPKGREGRVEYNASKRAALSSLRGL